MSDVLVSKEARITASGGHSSVPLQHPRQPAAMERAKTTLAQFDENLRLRPLPSVALALALGFIAARLAYR